MCIFIPWHGSITWVYVGLYMIWVAPELVPAASPFSFGLDIETGLMEFLALWARFEQTLLGPIGRVHDL